MSRLYKILFSFCLLSVLPSAAYAQGKYSEARGELLYTAHCNTCHTTQIHWREQRLVKDWESLVSQVSRWQSISGLSWTEEEISDVARYLNTLFYKYLNTAQDENPLRLILKD